VALEPYFFWARNQCFQGFAAHLGANGNSQAGGVRLAGAELAEDAM
jgi:hypothetical protein